ncbi:MAG: magnesium transporter, partial [Clostridiaceae bacterium]|nr:magnesium transporter [Clostridiaceae bacterium]
MKKELSKILIDGSYEDVTNVIEDIHPADILDVIHENEKKAYEILMRLPDWMVAAIIDEEEDQDKYNILRLFNKDRQKKILNEMSSDEITDLVGILSEDESKDILSMMNEEEREDVKSLLKYDSETAGGIMATEFISIKNDDTVYDTLKYLQKTAPDAESAYYIYVTDENKKLSGVISLRELVSSNFNTLISEIINMNVISVKYDVDQEVVANKFEKYGFLTMPVVDNEEHLLGIITADDIIEIVKNESTEDIHRLGGVDEEEKVNGTLKESIHSRLPWLFVNLLTALLASATVALFEGTISKVVALATFMPIVTGMGGNAGTQSLTIIVRGIALGEVDAKNARRIF